MMFFAFLFLLLLDGGIGVLVWLAGRRLSQHMKECPEAGVAIAKHVVMPLLGCKIAPRAEPKPEQEARPERVRGALE
jgi:hypothetical protein